MLIGNSFIDLSLTSSRYLREVGFPDNVLEARVARMTAYRSLYGQNQMLEQPQAAVRNEPPTPPSVSVGLCWLLEMMVLSDL